MMNIPMSKSSETGASLRYTVRTGKDTWGTTWYYVDDTWNPDLSPMYGIADRYPSEDHARTCAENYAEWLNTYYMDKP